MTSILDVGRPIQTPAIATSKLTYRHVLSPATLNASNPLRTIALCDIDAAYAQFEQARLGLDKDLPIAVQQWSGLIAINYPARKFGLSRHVSADEAKRKCPDLICVHVATYREGEDEAGYWPDAKPETHKVSLEHYRRESVKILAIFSEFCPSIEKASIDEAYLDFSAVVRDLLIERYPQLAKVPDGSLLGLDTPLPEPPIAPFEGFGHLIPVVPLKEPDEGDDFKSPSNYFCPPEVDEHPSWQDIAIMLGAELMQKCRDAVKDRLGYTCSAGIARNKTLAKLCAGYNKPDAQTVLRDAAIAGFLRPLQFSKIRFLGGKLGIAIASEFDAATVGDLWTVSLESLQEKFGPDAGLWTFEIIRGIDRAEVTKKTLVKSMISSKNFSPSITTWDEASHWLRIISTELFARLNEAKETYPTIWPKTVCLSFRNDQYSSKARQTPFPYTSKLSIDYILKHAMKLLKEFANEKSRDGKQFGICTNLCLQFQGLDRQEKGQRGIEGFLGDTAPSKKRPRETITNASTSSERPPKAPFGIQNDQSTSTKTQTVEAGREQEAASATFYCKLCKRNISYSALAVKDTDDAGRLKAAEQEHADYHFARDLMGRERVVVGSSSTASRKSTSARTAKISNFFTKT